MLFSLQGKDGLPILSAALGILEKYGRNLLKSNRPSQWKTISFSNAVFRTRVDIIKVGIKCALLGITLLFPCGTTCIFRLDIILEKGLSKHTLNIYFSGMKIDPKYTFYMHFS